jgi:ribonuclease-3
LTDERSEIASDDLLANAAAGWGLSGLHPARLRHALTHCSAVPARSPESNERLEFLGDGILNAVVADYLFRRFPDRTEGDLAKGRALVVSKVSLYDVGVRLGLPELIAVGANAEGMFARTRRSATADAVEALIAVVYLDFGWDAAMGFVLRLLAPELESLNVRSDLRDPKTILQELAQAKRCSAPEYRTIAETGEPHERLFTVEVTLYDGVRASGSGRSKKDAQQAAAAAALALIGDGETH